MGPNSSTVETTNVKDGVGPPLILVTLDNQKDLPHF